MQLTRLEINGFKSFGQKTVVHFDKGITGVVGPNGCGKSNIVDAVRWVLGEQKTTMLRSEKMEDVIFNGNKKKKPLNFAEVSLTFENTKNILPTDYTTVSIVRRFYRSGEGEYLLNGVQCRLKDITNLLLDTGIGPESYAIIELKMVEDILNDKNESRRILFEEASGISKYKLRKKETLRKLDYTDSDLTRVDDLLFEIEKNMSDLEKQAKRTERYYKLKEKYKLLSTQIALSKLRSSKEKTEELQRQIDKEDEKILGIQTQISVKESEIEKQKTEIETIEKNLSELQRDLNHHTEEISRKESEKSLKNQRIQFLSEKKINLKFQNEESENAIARTAEEIASLQETLVKEKEKFSGQEKNLQSLKQELEQVQRIHGENENRLREFQQKLNETQRKRDEKEKESEILGIHKKALEKELTQTDAGVIVKSEDIQTYEGKINEMEENLSALRKELDACASEQTEYNQLKQKLESTLKEVSAKLQESARLLDKKQNEHQLMKSYVENLEGFPESIKFLEKENSWRKKTYPLLSDVISCDEKYRVAIENILEPYMNYYVVDTRAEALQAIQLLSNASKGKANFFIRGELENFQAGMLRDFEGCISALQIVDVASEYRKLAEYLLHHVYLASDANKIPSEDSSLVFVTQEGAVIKKRYTLSGGSVGLFEGKRIGRGAKNLEKLAEEIKLLEKQNESLEKEKKLLEERIATLEDKDKKDEIRNLQLKIIQDEQTLSYLQAKQEEHRSFITNSQSRKEDIAGEIEKVEQQIKDIQPQFAQLQNEIQTMNNEYAQVQNVYEESKQKFFAVSNSHNEEVAHYHEQKSKTGKSETDIEFKNSLIAELEKRITQYANEEKQIADEEQSILNVLNSSDKEMIEMYGVKEQKEKTIQETEDRLFGVRGEIERYEKSIRELRNEKDLCDTVKNQLKETFNTLNLELHSVKERMEAEFQIDINNEVQSSAVVGLSDQQPSDGSLVKNTNEGETDFSEIEAEANSLKEKIYNYGEINPMAMDAYNESKQRYDFIKSQKEDLLKAKETLLNTIKEIDETARTRFLESFEKVRGSFQEIFRTLFEDGDTCDLVLLNPEQPLESEIDIIAKPRGKKPRGINQLSGGEKTLTAVALLFAIYLLKPAPFCIFDEVDAPLDDMNIDKFCNLVKKFSGNSQFIIVTHNKQTMSATRLMYGVTMEEEGISKLVPVDMRVLESVEV